jgi:hypothetical protein
MRGLQTQFKSAKPFSHLSLRNFLEPAFLKSLKAEIESLEFFEKSNDLFHFQQSKDLKQINTPQVTKLK